MTFPFSFPCRHLAVGLAATLLAGTVLAAPVALDLPAQPLADSLKQLGQAAGLTLMADAALLAGHEAPALSGQYEPELALRMLLAGSGLAGSTRNGALVITTPVDGAGPQMLDNVVVTGTAQTDLASASRSNHITREMLDRFPAGSASDMFKGIPGVMTANSRNGASLDLNIRGMQGFGRVKMLVDGTEASSSSYKGYGGETSRAYVDPELLGGVTVEKGPNAGPYGAGVVGGVVFMNTLSASDLIQSGHDYGLRLRGSLANNQAGDSHYAVLGPGPSGAADPAAGDAEVRDVSLPGRAWNGSVAGAWRPNGILELVAGVSHRQQGNYMAGSRGSTRVAPNILHYQPGGEVYNTSEDTDSYLLKAGLKLPGDQRLDLGYSRLDSRFGEARSAGYADYAEQLNLSHADKRLYTARYAWSPQDNSWIDFRANIWAANSNEYQANDIRGIALITGLHRAQYSHTRGRGMELWNTSMVDLLGRDLSLKYGATWMQEKVDIMPLAGSIYMEPDGKRRMHSFFVQAEFQPLQAVTLEAGLRHERYKVEGAGEVGAGVPGQILPLLVSDGASRNNPSAGIRWQLVRDWQLFGRYSEGWRPPSVKETINGLLADSNLGRALLKPEFVRSTEFGVKFERSATFTPGDALKAELSWFRNRTEDYVYGFAGEFRNAEQADFRGLELSVDYDAGVAFMNYGFTRYSQVSFCGVTLAFDSAPPCFSMPFESGWDLSMSGLYVPPKAQHSLTLGARLLQRRLVLGARMVRASDYGGNPVATGWSSYEVYDLFGSYRFNDRLSVNASVENLRDRFYMDAGTNGMLAMPAPGRTAKLSLTYAY